MPDWIFWVGGFLVLAGLGAYGAAQRTKQADAPGMGPAGGVLSPRPSGAIILAVGILCEDFGPRSDVLPPGP